MSLVTSGLDSRICAIGDWLLNSGIQDERGAFYAWLDHEDSVSSYLYSEITGYAITTLCFLYTLTNDVLYLQRAESAARWIIDAALHSSGGVLTRLYLTEEVEHYSFSRGYIYAFDCAMVAFAMLKLYKLTAQKCYLDVSRRIVDFLARRMLRADGLCYPIFDARSGQVCEVKDTWSRQAGSFHCKLTLPLCELAELEGNRHYLRLAQNIIEASMQHFYKDRFITNVSDQSSHFHPYCYTLEGLVFYSYKNNTDRYRDAIRQGFDWMVQFQDENGGLPTSVFSPHNIKTPYQRCDIQAQSLRLYFLIGAVEGENRVNNLNLDRLLQRLLSFQDVSSIRGGGFFFGEDKDGSYKKHSNSWCTMFGLQALYLAAGKLGPQMILEYLV